ncbi:hypothetical protein FRC11_013717 [Ceratobasidium sp. 423]|nr:hypothetical protein FRC11_013717 [Ceratobasidium sp. 423]
MATTTTATNSHAAPFKSSHPPGSLEWMHAQIAQLETELDSAKAVRDMAVSEQHVIRQAHRVEQDACWEAMSKTQVADEKSAAEAELSRKGDKQSQLRAELKAALARESALSENNNALRGLLVLAEGELKLVRPTLEESEKYGVWVKTLELELEEVQDRAHKLQLEKLRLEQQQADPTELANAREKLKSSNFEIMQLKADLASTQQQLEATQMSLELMEQKYSSARRMYETAKEKLGVYKEWLENQEKVMCKLKGTLTPEIYRSLRATTESWSGVLGATTTVGNHTSTSELSQVSSAMPESSDWMHARITQLETELNDARLLHDISTFEQSLLRSSCEVGQCALHEAMSQKGAAEAALSQQEAEQSWLHSGLEAALAWELALSNDVDTLHRQLADAEEKLRLAQLSLEESMNHGG